MKPKTKFEFDAFCRRFASMLVVSIAVIPLVGLTSGCDNARSITASPSAERPLQDGLILEMYTKSEYSVYPPGKVLNMKIYESGQAEYDHYPSESQKGEFELKRTAFALSVDELEMIRRLVDETLRSSRESYGPTVPIVDASIQTTLNLERGGRQKKIILNENHSNLILEKKKGVYPESLLNLLTFIQKKTDKYLGIDREST